MSELINAPVKILFLLGYDPKHAFRTEYETVKQLQILNKDVCVIGDGAESIQLPQIISLQGRINSSTQIYICGHGSLSDGLDKQHMIRLFTKTGDAPEPTEIIFKVLAYICDNHPLTVLVSSCFGARAGKHAALLPYGSIVVTPCIEDAPTYSSFIVDVLSELYTANIIELSLFLRWYSAGVRITRRVKQIADLHASSRQEIIEKINCIIRKLQAQSIDIGNLVSIYDSIMGTCGDKDVTDLYAQIEQSLPPIKLDTDTDTDRDIRALRYCLQTLLDYKLSLPQCELHTFSLTPNLLTITNYSAWKEYVTAINQELAEYTNSSKKNTVCTPLIISESTKKCVFNTTQHNFEYFLKTYFRQSLLSEKIFGEIIRIVYKQSQADGDREAYNNILATLKRLFALKLYHQTLRKEISALAWFQQELLQDYLTVEYINTVIIFLKAYSEQIFEEADRELLSTIPCLQPRRAREISQETRTLLNIALQERVKPIVVAAFLQTEPARVYDAQRTDLHDALRVYRGMPTDQQEIFNLLLGSLQAQKLWPLSLQGGQTLLTVAAEENAVLVVQRLLFEGIPPLSLARVIKKNYSVEVLRLFLETSSTKTIDRALENILYCAIEQSKYSGNICDMETKFLLLLQTFPELINVQDGQGITPLLFASKDRYVPYEIICALLNKGAEITQDLDGNTVLHVLCVNIDDDLRKIDSVLQIAAKESAKTLNIRNKVGLTALHLAAKANNVGAFCALIKTKGIDITVKDNAENTVLHQIIRKNNALAMLMALCQHPDFFKIVNLIDANGDTAFTIACCAHQTQYLIRLMQFGAIIAFDSEQNSPLHCVVLATYGYTDPIVYETAVEFMLKHKVFRKDLNAANRHKETPLHSAVSMNHRPISIVKMLLEAGADITAQDNDKNTAFHLAVKIKKIAMINMFLQYPKCRDVLWMQNIESQNSLEMMRPMLVNRESLKKELEDTVINKPRRLLLCYSR